MAQAYDAVIVGSGPNGLAAAITLARAGRSVLVIESKDTAGGGMRSAELTLPGFVSDICSAVHPLGVASPFFRSLPLASYGLEWVHPAAPLAHPLDDGSAVLVERSVERTAEGLGKDARAYRLVMGSLADRWPEIVGDLLGPLRAPRHPLSFAGFGLGAILPARWLAKGAFRGERARAVFAGMASHSIMSLEKPVTSAYGLILGTLAHGVGWPVARSGSQSIAQAMVNYLIMLGGKVQTGWTVESIDELPPARAYLFDVTPRQLLRIAGQRLPPGYSRQLERYRYGPGVFKLDLAIDGPIPWQARECLRAATVHVGGTLEEIAASEHDAWGGRISERPFVLLAQQSLFDTTRAPSGKQVVWAYCHVPNGSTVDMTDAIERQIERFAPGFRDRILARNGRTATQMEQYNPNYIGGDINGGVQDLFQHFTRPAVRLVPYSTPNPSIFLCSSSTPPGGGVHGMCGFYAAQSVLARVR
jgi:phytoene dehydrogenase-like protein